MHQQSLTVCITGAAGQIAYSFIPQLASGICFPGIHLHLRLLDIEPALNILRGVALELEDCSYPLVRSVSIH
jgi:malate/lactate dehydrogenase